MAMSEEFEKGMRVLFALQGFHRYDRGAETAFISLATELTKSGDDVTLIGSGCDRPNTPYRFIHCASVQREKFERFPKLPIFRNEYAYEELTFAFNLIRCYQPSDYDVSISCSYPFINWVLRRPVLFGKRPPHVFVTENGDWAAYARNSEYRLFGCEGLVCTNPDFFERNKDRWQSQLIPNGIDADRFSPGEADRREFGIPDGRHVVLMVSALIPSKRVEVGIQAVSRMPDVHLVVAGDGASRRAIDACAAQLLPGRFTRLSVTAQRMPALYRSADVFLHLSKDESFGNVFLEAMATGTPIVAHDSTRTRWIVGDEEYLLNTDDIGDIAVQLDNARREVSALRRKRITRAGSFSWSKVASEYRLFLSRIVGSL